MSEISLKELETDISIMLRSFQVPSRKLGLLSDKICVSFASEMFGVIVSAIIPADYSFIHKTLSEAHPGYRYVYISNADDIRDKRDELLWQLMRSGYMKYIRQNFPRQYNSIIMEGYGRKIINKRLAVWDNQPMYRFFIEENEVAKDMPTTMILSAEPSFFDYMP